jgi:hypothetical protein
MKNARYSCPILIKLEFFWQCFEKCTNVNFHENSFSGNPAFPCGQPDGRTDMTKLIVDSRNFVNGVKNASNAAP